MTTSDFYPMDDLPAMASHRHSLSSESTSVLKDLRHRRKDGTFIHVEIAARHIEYDGRPATLAVITDVSERVRVDRARVAAEEQLRASQRLEAVGKLTGGVAHDFNNIPMVIMANVDAVLESAGIDPETRRNMERIGGAAERATQLTRQLLAFSRKQTLRPQKTSLNDLVVATGCSAAADTRRTHRDQFAAGRRPLDDQYRSRPGRGGNHQPLHQRQGRDAGAAGASS